MCLLESLERHCPSFMIYMLCMDESCFRLVKTRQHPNVVALRLSELESAFPELISVKGSRSRLEYYYTCGPAFISYVMDNNPEINIITYLDADLYFFSNPAPLIEAFEGHSIGLVRHHLSEFRKKSPWQGIYNVGWLNFRRDPVGVACLEWWRDRCIEWCYERYEDGKYADQLYLNQWPKIFKGIYEINHHGANVGPWNVSDYRFSLRNGEVYVDDDPLIFYHFHGFKKIARNVYNTNLGLTLRTPPTILKRFVFLPYIERLEHYSQGQHPTASIRNYRPKHYLIKTPIRLLLGVLFRQYVIVVNGRVI